ncbi:hypothetical protein A3848_23820 [Paenibacillus sp. P32E]|nr:hypothetical protein A3848_23820 [Paenibacillus sp. P32E]
MPFRVVSEYGLEALEAQPRSDSARNRSRLEKERSILFATDKQGQLTSVYRAGETAITIH